MDAESMTTDERNAIDARELCLSARIAIGVCVLMNSSKSELFHHHTSKLEEL